MEISQVLSPNIEAFVQSCQKLSPTLVTTDSKDLTPAVQNSLGLKRKILGLIAPKQRTELQSVMRLACDFKIPMHPISTGCNWGFGSKLPYTENSFILDLSQLNKISNYDPVFGCVSIEPGVTQRQLMEFLNTQSSDYYLDMTGSSAESSVLGNTLERGIAYNSLRVEAVLRIEVLTLKGDLLQTGYAQWDQSLVKNLIKHSPGPNVEGLFFQSNLGIVANLTLQLKRKPDTEVFFNFNFPHVHLKEIIDTFGDLKRRYPWEAIVHIANRGRSQRMALHILQAAEKSLFQTVGSATAAAESITVQFPHEWIAIGSVKGPKPLVQEIVGHLKKGLKKKGRWVHFQTHQLEFAKKFTARLGLKNLRLRLELASTLSGLSQGRTTNATLQGFFCARSLLWDRSSSRSTVCGFQLHWIYLLRPLGPIERRTW